MFPLSSLDIQASCATTGDGLYEGLDWLSEMLKTNAAKEAVSKPIKETKDSLINSHYTFSSLYSSIANYFSGVH